MPHVSEFDGPYSQDLCGKQFLNNSFGFRCVLLCHFVIWVVLVGPLVGVESAAALYVHLCCSSVSLGGKRDGRCSLRASRLFLLARTCTRITLSQGFCGSVS